MTLVVLFCYQQPRENRKWHVILSYFNICLCLLFETWQLQLLSICHCHLKIAYTVTLSRAFKSSVAFMFWYISLCQDIISAKHCWCHHLPLTAVTLIFWLTQTLGNRRCDTVSSFLFTVTHKQTNLPTNKKIDSFQNDR